MGATRKLQGEIDRVLKKVQEGVDVFDSIWNKVYDTENANQKEKFEADLKKEIKKLQRYRDQIKTWIQSSEIKDKKVAASYEQALLDARKLIEREMERFKVCEKETKTKAFSKEGLGLQPKTDPREKAKGESRDWLNNMVSELESQIDSFEAEMEGLSVKKGKSRPPRLTHLEESISRHKQHIIKLEQILRLLDNDELSPDEVSDVKDFVEDYVDRNQDDFDDFAVVDDLYQSLPLEKMEALETLDAVPIIPPAVLVKEKSAVGGTTEETGLPELLVDLSPETPSAALSPTAQASVSIPIPATLEGPSAGIADGTPPGPSQTLTGSSPVLPGLVPAVPKTPTSSVQTLLSSTFVNRTKEEDGSNVVGRRPGSIISEGSLGKASSIGPAHGPASLGAASPVHAPLNSGGSGHGFVGGAGSGVGLNPSDSMKRPGIVVDDRVRSVQLAMANRMLEQPGGKLVEPSGSGEGALPDGANRVFSPPIGSSQQWRPHAPEGQFPYGGRTEVAPDQKQKFLERLHHMQQQSHGGTLLGPSAGSKPNNSLLPQVKKQPATQQSSQSSLPGSGSSPDLGRGMEQQAQLAEDSSADTSTLSAAFSSSVSLISEDDLKNHDTFDVSVGGPGSLEDFRELPRDVDFSPGLVAPVQSSVMGRQNMNLGAIGDKQLGANSALHDQQYNKDALASAYLNIPQHQDSERPKSYIPRNPAVAPSSYPQVPVPITDNPALWEHLDTEILFFAFYFQQGTYQQYLAARELKKHSWRYHKKYNTWFQRHEEPKITTDEFEQGTYVYFDFHIVHDDHQQGWCQRIKTEFTFEYSYLEDELMV
ncbi:unnamed protein product [Calypogeia fissa]